MEFLNLLNSIKLPLLNDGTYGTIDAGLLGGWVGALITAIGITGIGIIVFTLILKFIVLPLDIYQRAAMRNQSLKMEKMRGRLEKLQKQYANDKDLYNKKMMELYKENKINMFSSCIPMIASFVILIIAFNALQSYSQYENLSVYTDMMKAYNTEILAHCDENVEGVDVTIDGVTGKKYQGADNTYFIYSFIQDNGEKYYYLDIDKTYNYDKESIDAIISAENEINTKDDACVEYIYQIGREAAAKNFKEKERMNEKGVSFLWVKNIWYPDVPWASPINKDYKGFTSSIRGDVTILDSEGNRTNTKEKVGQYISEPIYKEITYNLETEKNSANGYLILVLLSVGTMLLTQFITMRSQKATTDLQSVDGTGKNTQKIMMWMMPLLFGVFAFMYSASFSIYMVISSIFSTLTTVITNIFVNKGFSNKEEKELQEKYNRTIPTKRKKD